MRDIPVIKLLYPPSELFQRGEDRCQSNISSSSATSIRACNDLGYAASVLKARGYKVFLRDYQTEGLKFEDLMSDLSVEMPEIIFLSTTNATVFDDIKIVKEIKKVYPNISFILKGAIFFKPEEDLIKSLDLEEVDYLIGGESDFIIGELVDAHFNNGNFENIGGILYKENGVFKATDFDKLNENLDDIPFPDRSLMNNSLYIRPDTKEIQATIATSRGCPSSCIFCLTPVISGRKLRLRSPKSIVDELEECYTKFGIKNFFFKSDTFTFNKNWTLEVCDLIKKSKLHKKISWAANSRVNPIDFETLKAMKEAGCYLVAFGFESGSENSLKLMKKGTTVEQNIEAAKMAKKAGLSVYGFYLIGFPWENMEDLKATEDLIYKIDADFIELHIATPFYDTPLYEIAKEEGLIDESVLGKDYFNAPTIGTKFLKIEEIQEFRNKLLLKYYTRPQYIIKKVFSALNKPKVLQSYCYYGIRLIKNCLRK